MGIPGRPPLAALGFSTDCQPGCWLADQVVNLSEQPIEQDNRVGHVSCTITAGRPCSLYGYSQAQANVCLGGALERPQLFFFF